MACTDGDDGWETIPKKSRRIKKKADNGGCVKEEKVWTHSFEPIVEPPNCTNTPSILLLVGLPGSGKSTFSTELCRLLPWKYVRVNQDELKTRGKCIAAVEAADCRSSLIAVTLTGLNANPLCYWGKSTTVQTQYQSTVSYSM